jgi:hypothetical protein
MGNEMEKPGQFDPNAAVKAIRDKIRKALVEIIPDEQWDALIKAEMRSFMQDTTSGSGYRETVQRAGFKDIVRKVLIEDTEARVRALLTSPEWTGAWGPEGEQASDAIKKYMTQNAGEIMNAWIGNAVQQVVSQLRQRG